MRDTRDPVLRATAVVLALLVAACGGNDDNGASAPSTTSTSAPSVTATVDWVARTVTVDGDTRFDVAFCEGDAPLLCVSEGGAALGAVERSLFPSPVADLHAWARANYASFARDRSAGCDPDYVLDGENPSPAHFGEIDGVRYGFTGRVGGRIVERVTGYVASTDAGLDLLVANALVDDGCLSRQSELPVDVMDDLEPLLGALAAGSRLGDARESWSIGDGQHSGRIVSVAGGVLTVDPAVVLSGEEAVATARIDGQLPPEGGLPNDFYIVDHEHDTVDLPLRADATVELFDCTGGCERRTVDTAAFLDGTAVPYGGPNAMVELDASGGEVVALREVYLP